jgi:hypothetical protein
LPLPRFVDYSLRFIAPISLSLAIYFHYQSVQERIPTYYVVSTRTRIVDTSTPAPPQLQILYKGKNLNTDISAAIVYFWNDGKLPIKAEDVLEPLKIELDPSCAIIEARVVKVSRGVTKFAKGDISETAKNSLPLSFGILEHNDGAVLQIIYSGKPDAHVSISGVTVGAGQPRETTIEQYRPKGRTPSGDFLFTMATVALAAVGMWLFGPHLRLSEELFGKRRKLIFALLLFLACILPALGLYAKSEWISKHTVPSSIWTENQN